MNEIISEKFAYQDIMKGNACSNCLHSVEEHGSNKCFALDYDGTTYSSCKCS